MIEQRIFAGNGFFVVLDHKKIWKKKFVSDVMANRNESINFEQEIQKYNQRQSLDPIKKVSVKYSHILLITESGKIFGRGDGYCGCLGNGRQECTLRKFEEVSLFSNLTNKAKNVFTGNFTSFVLMNNEILYGFGANNGGQLGIKKGSTCYSYPTKIKTKFLKRDTIKDIKGGGNHTILLSNNGRVFSTGDNYYGQLANGKSKESSFSFKLIKFFEKKKIEITQIAAGARHSAFLTKNEVCYSCGFNDKGQLGVNHNFCYETSIPKKVFLYNVKKIACGASFSFFLTKFKDTKIYGAGLKFTVPFEIKKKNLVDIYCGSNSSFFVTNRGEILLKRVRMWYDKKEFFKGHVKIPDLKIELKEIIKENTLGKEILDKQKKCIYFDCKVIISLN